MSREIKFAKVKTKQRYKVAAPANVSAPAEAAPKERYAISASQRTLTNPQADINQELHLKFR